MSLQAALSLILEEYRRESQGQFAGNALGELVRKEVPKSIESILTNTARYEVKGSVGQGTWAHVPWIAVLDRLVTDSAQSGYYVVYLFAEDCSRVYLSLNQGVTTAREIYGVDVRSALKSRASDLLARLIRMPNGYEAGEIDLRTGSDRLLANGYEVGNICAKYYEKAAIPDDETLTKDLHECLELYRRLADNEIVSGSSVSCEDDESDESYIDIQNLRLLREHKRIERNKWLSKQAKQHHGYKCQACGFDFERIYGELGRRYIEAHHLVPLHTLKDSAARLDARKDFAVLCANCHRMIHRSNLSSDVSAFAKAHLRTRQLDLL